MAISIEDEKFKELVKAALIDVLEERRDLGKDIFVEVIDDMALGKAIAEGLGTDPIPRNEILGLLDNAPQ
jgi:predicted Zn-dependent protease with MMP-like domain